MVFYFHEQNKYYNFVNQNLVESVFFQLDKNFGAKTISSVDSNTASTVFYNKHWLIFYNKNLGARSESIIYSGVSNRSAALLLAGASEASRKWVGTKIFNLRIFRP